MAIWGQTAGQEWSIETFSREPSACLLWGLSRTDRLRPGAEPSWPRIADAINEQLSTVEKHQKSVLIRILSDCFLSLHYYWHVINTIGAETSVNDKKWVCMFKLAWHSWVLTKTGPWALTEKFGEFQKMLQSKQELWWPTACGSGLPEDVVSQNQKQKIA